MDTWKSLSAVQKILLLGIAGVASLIALDGLSQTHKDYYVTAAVSRAFFSAVLLLVVSSPFLYVFRRRKKKPEAEYLDRQHTDMSVKDRKSDWENSASPVQKKKDGMTGTILSIVIGMFILGLIGSTAKYIAQRIETLLPSKGTAETQIHDSTDCAIIPIENGEKVVVQTPFDPHTPPEGAQFYVLPEETSPWTKTQISVDRDQFPLEDVYTAKTAMNHTPHVVKIVKDGVVLFMYEGAGLAVQKVDDLDGFMLEETLDWNAGTSRRTRYVYEDGGFRPVWYQENCVKKE